MYFMGYFKFEFLTVGNKVCFMMSMFFFNWFFRQFMCVPSIANSPPK